MPKFKRIPKVANYLAQQPDGQWWCYEHKPIKVNDGTVLGIGWRPSRGFCDIIYQDIENWEETLTET